jgi:putative oxidoreductase
MRFFPQLQPLALLVMRVSLGAIILAHGLQKARNIGRFMGLLGSIGVPSWMAYVVTGVEVGGGILLIIGLLTPWAALAITCDMAVAIATVHFPKGLTGAGGYEFTLALISLAFALIFFGAGPFSLDYYVFGGKRGPGFRKR